MKSIIGTIGVYQCVSCLQMVKIMKTGGGLVYFGCKCRTNTVLTPSKPPETALQAPKPPVPVPKQPEQGKNAPKPLSASKMLKIPTKKPKRSKK